MTPLGPSESTLVTVADTNVKEFLTHRLDLLDAEKPRDVFATDDMYKVIIRNESGSDVFGGLSKKPLKSLFGILTLSVPGYLNRMNYLGLTVYDHGDIFTHIAHNPDGTWVGIGRRSQQDTLIEEVKFGFDVEGANYSILPFGNQEDATLADRITDVFRKYGVFEIEQEKKSRHTKPLYDLSRYCQRILGLQKPSERRLLTSEKE